MPFLNVKVSNNGASTLEAGISAGIWTLILATGTRGLFPSTFPFFLTVEKFNASLQVTKREIVKVTAGATEALTITRSAGYCPADYTATTLTNTAFSFDAGDSVKLKLVGEIIDDMNTELARLETAKLNLTGGALTGRLDNAQSADIASATPALSAATGNSAKITGTTTISSFGTVQAGVCMELTFTGMLTLTYNATSMILPNAGSNITTAAGDSAVVVSLWSGNWKFISYTKADGTALVSSSPSSATTVAEGVARLSTDAEARAWTLTNTIITPAQLAMMKVSYQIKFPVENATYIDTFTGSDQLQACPDYIYTAYSTTGTNTRIHRYDRQTNGSYVYRGTIANITVASWSCCGITVIGSYVYVWQHDGGAGGIRVYRLALDLTGSTLMTGTMAMTNSTNRTCMTGDGTDIFHTDYNGSFQVATVKRYTISGTTLSSASTITLSVVWTNNSHYLYKFPSGGIYVIPRGATVSSIAYWNNAGTAQTAITTLLSTYTANIEQAMWFFKYAGTACFARMRKNDATNSSDILLQSIDLV